MAATARPGEKPSWLPPAVSHLYHPQSHMGVVTVVRDGEQVQLQLSKKLGSGADGSVYQLIDRSSESSGWVGQYVVKQVRVVEHQIALKMKQCELSILEQLGLLHGASFYDGTLTMVMPYAGSETLEGWAKKPHSASELLKMQLSVLRAVKALHDRGILHRDIKPANMMVAADGTVNLVDFGFSVDRDSTYGRWEGQTFVGHFSGTPRFLPLSNPLSNYYQGRALKGIDRDVRDIDALAIVKHRYAFLNRCRDLHGKTIFDALYTGGFLKYMPFEGSLPRGEMESSTLTDTFAVCASIERVFVQQAALGDKVLYEAAGPLLDFLAHACHPDYRLSLDTIITVVSAVLEKVESDEAWPDEAFFAGYLSTDSMPSATPRDGAVTALPVSTGSEEPLYPVPAGRRAAIAEEKNAASCCCYASLASFVAKAAVVMGAAGSLAVAAAHISYITHAIALTKIAWLAAGATALTGPIGWMVLGAGVGLMALGAAYLYCNRHGAAQQKAVQKAPSSALVVAPATGKHTATDAAEQVPAAA